MPRNLPSDLSDSIVRLVSYFDELKHRRNLPANSLHTVSLCKNYFPEWVVRIKLGKTDGAHLWRFDFSTQPNLARIIHGVSYWGPCCN